MNDKLKTEYNLELGIWILERYLYKIQASKDYHKYEEIMIDIKEVIKKMYKLNKGD